MVFLHQEALLHPEVNPLDEGFKHCYLLSLSVKSIQQPALVTKLSEALLLDVAFSLTLRVTHSIGLR